MILKLAEIIAKLFGLGIGNPAALKWARRVVLFVIIAVLIIAGLWIRSCVNKPPRLNEQQIQKAQQAIAKQEREEMLEVLAESDTAEDAIDSSLKQIEIDKEAAKRSYSGFSNDELAAELERRK